MRQPACGRAELVGRAAGGVDDGQAAGHRLEHRHGEALAAIGMHEHVAGAVERGHLLVVEVGVEVHERAGRAASACTALRSAPR